MIETDNFLTGDHAEINTITLQKKEEEQQKAFANLPLKAQELLAPRPTFFDGSCQEAEKLLGNTKEFASFNQIKLSFSFDAYQVMQSCYGKIFA